MNHQYPIETYCWSLGPVLITAVAEGGETAITLTVTASRTVDGPGSALAALIRALNEAKIAILARA